MERRLAAILAADVVGYSRLMERDESGTLTALTAMREEILQPLVDRHHGRVVKLMGDGVLAEFSSAVNAVACAVDVQGAMAAADADVPGDQRIVLRIGINLGDVMVQGTDLYGDGVNVAARLEAMGEPGTVYISGSIHDQVEGKLDIDFQDIGLQSVKNMAAPVRVYRIVPAAKAAGESRRSKHDASPLPSKPSIAVLPFMNMSGDAEQQYFSDGITEDIITELSRFRQLFVIARNSSFQYRGQDVDVKRLGRELGVQYVVEGSVRRAGNRVRVTAQLIDAPTGHHVWAERYDRDLEDIFAVQDEVTRRIVTSIAPRLQSEETHVAGRKLPGDMRAYDHYLKAKLLVDTPADVGDLERAREHCSAAIGIDPAYARAHATGPSPMSSAPACWSPATSTTTPNRPSRAPSGRWRSTTTTTYATGRSARLCSAPGNTIVPLPI